MSINKSETLNSLHPYARTMNWKAISEFICMHFKCETCLEDIIQDLLCFHRSDDLSWLQLPWKCFGNTFPPWLYWLQSIILFDCLAYSLYSVTMCFVLCFVFYIYFLYSWKEETFLVQLFLETAEDQLQHLGVLNNVR